MIVFLVLTLAAIAAKAEVIRIYADALTLQIDLTRLTSDPAFLIAQIPVGQTVGTAGSTPGASIARFGGLTFVSPYDRTSFCA